jgi:hypothetical protein
VAERSLLFGRKTWFADARTPVRRMGVSQHPEEGVVVVSLWQGEVCTGTFRLPMADAPRLIAELADALGAALPVGTEPGPDGSLRRLMDRLLPGRLLHRRLLHRRPVPPLRRVK